MRIEIKRQSAETLSPDQLVEYLNYELKLSGRVTYNPEGDQYGVLTIFGKEPFDKEKLGHILSEMDYVQITEFDKPKPKKNRLERISIDFGNLREKARQLGEGVVRRLREAKGLNSLKGGQR